MRLCKNESNRRFDLIIALRAGVFTEMVNLVFLGLTAILGVHFYRSHAGEMAYLVSWYTGEILPLTWHIPAIAVVLAFWAGFTVSVRRRPKAAAQEIENLQERLRSAQSEAQAKAQEAIKEAQERVSGDREYLEQYREKLEIDRMDLNQERHEIRQQIEKMAVRVEQAKNAQKQAEMRARNASCTLERIRRKSTH